MKKIIIILLCSTLGLIYAAPLDKPAQDEFDYSKKFLRLEQIQKDYTHKYVILVKARYLLRKEIPWVSRNILQLIELQSKVIYIRNVDED